MVETAHNWESAHESWGDLPERQDPTIDEQEWLDNLSPSDIVTIHMTDTFPSDGKVRSHVGWAQEGAELRGVRDTVHFTLNGPVQTSHGLKAMGPTDWGNRKFVVLSPFDKFEKEQVWNFKTDDTYIIGDLDMPEGTHVLLDWSEITTLCDRGIISVEEMFEALNQGGAIEGGSPQVTQDTTIERNGITYTLCNLSGGNFRERIYDEIKEMGYRGMNIYEHGWDCDESRAMGRKNELRMVGLHSNDFKVKGIEDFGNEIYNRIGSHGLDPLIYDLESGERGAETTINEFCARIESAISRTNGAAEDSPHLARAAEVLQQRLDYVLQVIHLRLKSLTAPASRIDPRVQAHLNEVKAWIATKCSERSEGEENRMENYLNYAEGALTYTMQEFIKRIDSFRDRTYVEAEDVLDYMEQKLERLIDQYLPIINSPEVSKAEQDRAREVFTTVLNQLLQELKFMPAQKRNERTEPKINLLEGMIERRIHAYGLAN